MKAMKPSDDSVEIAKVLVEQHDPIGQNEVFILANEILRLSATEAPADGLVERLTDCLNHAVTQLTAAALDENYDSQDCMDCVERIQDTLKPLGKTSDWHTLSNWYDRLCAACGVDNGDEIEILPLVEKKLREAPALPSTRAEVLEGWIAVSDRLPEQYARALVWRDGIPEWVGPIIAFWTGEKWAVDVMKDDLQVTHWRDLPTPPAIRRGK